METAKTDNILIICLSLTLIQDKHFLQMYSTNEIVIKVDIKLIFDNIL